MSAREMDELFAGQLRGEEAFDGDGMGDGHVMLTEDGCEVEPDGKCSHGFESPARRLLGI